LPDTGPRRIAVAETVTRTFARIRAADDPAIFIALREEVAVQADARALADGDRSLPLYGIPVAVKDNIDVAGLPTTAACPAYAYQTDRDATVVARLHGQRAVVGKTNLDSSPPVLSACARPMACRATRCALALFGRLQLRLRRCSQRHRAWRSGRFTAGSGQCRRL
jgi:hypothetical protein